MNNLKFLIKVIIAISIIVILSFKTSLALDKAKKKTNSSQSQSNYGYEKTTWGMSLEKVKKNYPKGKIVKNQKNESYYNIVRGSCPKNS